MRINTKDKIAGIERQIFALSKVSKTKTKKPSAKKRKVQD